MPHYDFDVVTGDSAPEQQPEASQPQAEPAGASLEPATPEPERARHA